MGQRGFTLLELLAVLVLISIAMTLLVTAMGRGFSGMHERQAVDELMQALRQGHVLAITEQRPVFVTMDLATLCYRVDTRPQRCLPPGFSVTAQAAAGRSAQEAGFAFHADGSASGGNLRVRTPVRAVRIDINWLTGNAAQVTL